jgi:hypothetical protein
MPYFRLLSSSNKLQFYLMISKVASLFSNFETCVKKLKCFSYFTQEVIKTMNKIMLSPKNVYIPKKVDSTEICPIYNKADLLCNNMLLLSSLQSFFPVFLRHLLPQLEYFIKILQKIHRRTTNWICLLILKNDRIYDSNFF